MTAGQDRFRDSGSPGSGIGNAGVLTGTGSGVIVSGSDDWWVIYPARAGGTVDVTVQNNASAGSSCAAIFATLYSTQGSAGAIVWDKLDPGGGAGQLTGSRPGSDRYYVDVTPDNCASAAPYSISLISGGGGTPPAPIHVAFAPGSSIGTAWPPLRGHVSYSNTIGPADGTENWFVVYKRPDSRPATIRVTNTTAKASANCADLNVTVYTNAGTNGFFLAEAVPVNAALILSLPGRQAGDPQGQYYLKVTRFECVSDDATYTVEPEPGTEWANPPRTLADHVKPAASIGGAWPPLSGGRDHPWSINFRGGTENWYILYKKPSKKAASLVVANTTPDGSTSCANINITLYSNVGIKGFEGDEEIGNNAVFTFPFPARLSGDPQGQYYLEITAFECVSGGARYTIEPEPGSQWANPALKIRWTSLKNGRVGRAYAVTIKVSEGRNPYSFTLKSALPPGLKLNRHTGLISGRPRKAGRYSFRVNITDSTRPHHKSLTQRFSIRIS